MREGIPYEYHRPAHGFPQCSWLTSASSSVARRRQLGGRVERVVGVVERKRGKETRSRKDETKREKDIRKNETE